MEDRINSLDPIKTCSTCQHPMPPLDRRTEDVGVAGLVGCDFLRGGTLNPSSITECEGNTSTLAVVTPEPDAIDSDAVWVAMLKHQNQALASQASGWQLFRLGATDHQRDEVENANRRVFLDSLQRSYAKRSDTIVWSMIVFILAATVLTSLLGVVKGATFAVFVSICWTAVHRVRRL